MLFTDIKTDMISMEMNISKSYEYDLTLFTIVSITLFENICGFSNPKTDNNHLEPHKFK
jgi:hypothetical protein